MLWWYTTTWDCSTDFLLNYSFYSSTQLSLIYFLPSEELRVYVSVLTKIGFEYDSLVQTNINAPFQYISYHQILQPSGGETGDVPLVWVSPDGNSYSTTWYSRGSDTPVTISVQCKMQQYKFNLEDRRQTDKRTMEKYFTWVEHFTHTFVCKPTNSLTVLNTSTKSKPITPVAQRAGNKYI